MRNSPSLPGSNKAHYLGMILIFVVSIWIVVEWMFVMIGGGLSVTPDSVNYLQIAQNIQKGRGIIAFDQPFVDEPPGYPFMIALASMLRSGDVYRGAYWLQVGLIILNTILVGLSVYLSSGKKLLAMAAGLGLFFFTGPILRIHATIWSESLFFSLVLGSFLSFALYINTRRWAYLILTALIVGISIMVRYVGITLLAPYLFYLLFLDRRPLKEKLKFSGLFLFISLSFFLFWVIRNLIQTDSPIGRGMTVLPFSVDHIQQLINTLFDFWIPLNMRPWYKAPSLLLIFSLMVLGCIYLYRQYKNGAAQLELPLTWIICGLVFRIAYIAFMLFINHFVDSSIAFDNRMFAAVYILILIISISLVYWVAKATNQPSVWWFFLVIVFYILFIKLDRALDTVIDIQTNGRGYTSQRWRDSETIRYIGKILGEVAIFSNGADVIWFKTNGQTSMAPKQFSSFTGEPIPSFNQEMIPICQALSIGEAVYIDFKNVDRPYMPGTEDILQLCGPLEKKVFNDGVVLGKSVHVSP